jgi:transcriptional regulator with XRE-family HTH domain
MYPDGCCRGSTEEARRAVMPADDRGKEIGARLRECRLGAKLSLADVAAEMSLTKQAVSSWESGRTKMTALQLRDLVLLFGVSSDYILFGTHMVPQAMHDSFMRAPRS